MASIRGTKGFVHAALADALTQMPWALAQGSEDHADYRIGSGRRWKADFVVRSPAAALYADVYSSAGPELGLTVELQRTELHPLTEEEMEAYAHLVRTGKAYQLPSPLERYASRLPAYQDFIRGPTGERLTLAYELDLDGIARLRRSRKENPKETLSRALLDCAVRPATLLMGSPIYTGMVKRILAANPGATF